MTKVSTSKERVKRKDRGPVPVSNQHKTKFKPNRADGHDVAFCGTYLGLHCQIVKALIMKKSRVLVSLQGCAGSPESLLRADALAAKSHVLAQINFYHSLCYCL